MDREKKKYYIDCRLPPAMQKKLTELGAVLTPLEKNRHFEEPVSAHPDMNVLIIKDRIFRHEGIESSCYDTTKSIKTVLKYPKDVSLNAVCIGNDLICNRNYIQSDALRYAEQQGMNIISVKQGYTHCSIAVVSEKRKAVITEDRGVASALIENGYDVLPLSEHVVKLQPYDYGFIGGACGLMESNGRMLLTFFGNIENHPEYEAICKFCSAYDVIPYSLSDGELLDCGGMIAYNES